MSFERLVLSHSAGRRTPPRSGSQLGGAGTNAAPQDRGAEQAAIQRDLVAELAGVRLGRTNGLSLAAGSREMAGASMWGGPASVMVATDDDQEVAAQQIEREVAGATRRHGVETGLKRRRRARNLPRGGAALRGYGRVPRSRTP